MFARWNVDGVLAGFTPDQAYQEAHKTDVRDSPMMQKFGMDNVEDRATTNDAKVRISLAQKIADGANELLREWGVKGLRADPEYVKRLMGRSPIELGSPALTTLPKQPMPYPGAPTRSEADVNRGRESLYRVRTILDH
jgi:hypothetical protein